jgi:hypothetical protein
LISSQLYRIAISFPFCFACLGVSLTKDSFIEISNDLVA